MKVSKLQKCIALALLVVLTLCTTPKVNAYTAAGLNVYYINVGHGDAILLQQGNEYALVDTGDTTGWDKLENFLIRKNVTTLKYLIITHYDVDHCANVTKVMNSVNVQNLVYRSLNDSQKNVLNGTGALTRYNAINKKTINKITDCYAGCDSLPLGTANLTFYNRKASYLDDKDYSSKALSTRINLDSLVFMATYGTSKFLFAGDAGVETLEYITKNYKSAVSSTDVYKVSHHGLSANNQPEFLNIIKAKYAIMTTGYKPTEQTLSTTISRLHKANTSVKIYSTQNIPSFVNSPNANTNYTGILVMSNGSSMSSYAVYDSGTLCNKVALKTTGL